MLEGALAINPLLAILIGMCEPATPVTKVGESFVLKRNPVSSVIIQGDESAMAKR